MHSALAAAVLLAAPAALVAQGPAQPSRSSVGVGASMEVTSFGVAASATGEDGQPLEFSPYRPTIWGLRLGYGRHVRITGSVGFGQAGLLVRGGTGATTPGLLVVSPDVFHLAVFAGSVSAPLLYLKGGPVVRPSLGIRAERWTTPDAPARLVAGGAAGLAIEFALSRTFGASVGAEVGLTPDSPFRKEDLPEDFTRHSTWRRSVAVSLSWWP